MTFQQAINEHAAALAKMVARHQEWLLGKALLAHPGIATPDDIRARCVLKVQSPVRPNELERFWVEVDGVRVGGVWASKISDDYLAIGIGEVEP